MRPLALLAFFAMPLSAVTFDQTAAERFAQLALDCVHREYPNKLSHVLNSAADAKPPRDLTPAFYGCYDWHSSVHGHWLLARLARQFPQASFTRPVRAALNQSLTPANVRQEAAYLQAPGRASFERPYGLAWLLTLAAELHEWDDPDAQRWAVSLEPVEAAAVARLTQWLGKLSYPVRSGEHSNTAFSLGLTLDYARRVHNPSFAALLETKARQFYLHDQACPVAYEPSGEDFLSPCLAEADLMRRVLPSAEYTKWIDSFLPSTTNWFTLAVSPDPTDGKLAHLDGLNLSRAWMMEGIVSAVPAADPRQRLLQSSAAAHREAGLRAVTGEHYEGGHWLGSFAVYLVTRRGLDTSASASPASTRR